MFLSSIINYEKAIKLICEDYFSIECELEETPSGETPYKVAEFLNDIGEYELMTYECSVRPELCRIYFVYCSGPHDQNESDPVGWSSEVSFWWDWYNDHFGGFNSEVG